MHLPLPFFADRDFEALDSASCSRARFPISMSVLLDVVNGDDRERGTRLLCKSIVDVTTPMKVGQSFGFHDRTESLGEASKRSEIVPNIEC